MDPKVQKVIIPYDLESLKNSLDKHKENIVSMETAIQSERKAIAEEEMMIATIEVRANELNG